MRRVLHILTRANDELAQSVCAEQRADPDCEVSVVDLTGRAPDYQALLDQIFEADSVQVW